MPSVPEIDQLLAELNGRRSRILTLAGGGDPNSQELIHEMEHLAKQLVVADEEVRVQQEELRDALSRLAAATHGQSLLYPISAAQVITDPGGMVHDTNRAADQLLRRTSPWAGHYPIAACFKQSHRTHVRALISRMATGLEQQQLRAVLLLRPDASLVPVSVTVTRAVAAGNAADLLRWELRPLTRDPVPTAGTTSQPAVVSPTDPLVEIALVATGLATLETVEAVCEAAVAAVRRIVPGARGASVILRPAQPPPAAPGELLVPLPGRDSSPGDLVVQLDPMVQVEPVVEIDPVVPSIRAMVTVLATHVAVALTRVSREQQLRLAIDGRQHIGQAVGILMERHRMTPASAFDMLVEASNRRNIKVRDIARAMVETGLEPGDVDKP